MGLSKQRIHPGKETDFPWEREAVDFVLNHKDLADVDPYQAWPLHEFSDPSTGRLYEVDLLILGRHALYVVEIKSHPGVLRGDSRDWYFSDPATGKNWTLDNPYSLTNKKAQVLRGLLQRHNPELKIRVEALVFVSNPSAVIKLSNPGNERAVGRENVIRAITYGERLDEYLRRNIINQPMMRAVSDALRKAGFRAPVAKRLVGEYELGALLSEDEGSQEHVGQHRTIADRRTRIRSYLVPRATTTERAQHLRRAAQREENILRGLGEHPGILRCVDYVEDAPLGPAVLFDHFEGVALDAFLRQQKENKKELSFDERLMLIQRISEALDHCHKKNVLHRNLNPSSVLVGESKDGPRVKLHHFHLAQRDDSGTSHFTAFMDDDTRVYSAPEVLDDPAKARVESDIFSLGALSYLILTGQPPANSIKEYQKCLDDDQGFLMTRVRDDFSQPLVDLVQMATSSVFANRPDSAMDWCHMLLEAVTAPQPADGAATQDPHTAAPGTKLEYDLTVDKVLGSGSTAKVLKVHDANGRIFALKVPHDERYAERLTAEARTLSNIRHHHIVQTHGMRSIGGRNCLLLDFAAERTLASMLREDGTVNLDYARRFGDDLLGAVQYLEENGVQHRDIKPANIGFTPDDKQARHLILFDFSLSDLDPTSVALGTASYRDPSLRRRGRWDAAADRYSAAVTLYQMLTGALPGNAEDGADLLQAERFDASIRDRLIHFFIKALHVDASERFLSAEVMRQHWVTLFDTQLATTATTAPTAPAAPVSSHAASPEPLPAVSEADKYAGVTLDTAVEALHLSIRARNALDRAGLDKVRDLLTLPRNHLSAVRGVGWTVAKEIQQAADDLRKLLSVTAISTPDPLAPHYRGPRTALRAGGVLKLSKEAFHKLADAGIANTLDLAQAPRTRIEHCVGRALADELQRLLESTQIEAGVQTLTEWMADLLPPLGKKGNKKDRQIRAYLGLEALVPPPVFALAPDAADVAKSLDISRSTVLKNVRAEMETRWAQCASLPLVMAACVEAVKAAGNVCPYRDAVAALVKACRAPGTSDEEATRQAAALLRIATEAQESEDGTVHLGRVGDEPWVALDAQVFTTVQALGALADRMASENPLPSTETVRSHLGNAVLDTSLASLPVDRLAQIAVAASKEAALSARLEFYPRGLSAERALQLSVGVLSLSEIKPDALRDRIKARYPSAVELPPRPALDELLRPHGLVFNEEDGVYRRPGQEALTSTFTHHIGTRLSTAISSETPSNSPAAVEARAFQASIANAMAKGRFRVLQVPKDDVEPSARTIAENLGVTLYSVDALVWEQVQRLARDDEIPLEVIFSADRLGPTGPEWGTLRGVVADAARAVVKDLLARRNKPILLTQLGVFARYKLVDALQNLVDHAEKDEGASILLLVPSQDDGEGPTINHEMPVPAPLPGQRLRVPRSWLLNAHLAASSLPS